MRAYNIALISILLLGLGFFTLAFVAQKKTDASLTVFYEPQNGNYYTDTDLQTALDSDNSKDIRFYNQMLTNLNYGLICLQRKEDADAAFYAVPSYSPLLLWIENKTVRMQSGVLMLYEYTQLDAEYPVTKDGKLFPGTYALYPLRNRNAQYIQTIEEPVDISVFLESIPTFSTAFQNWQMNLYEGNRVDTLSSLCGSYHLQTGEVVYDEAKSKLMGYSLQNYRDAVSVEKGEIYPGTKMEITLWDKKDEKSVTQSFVFTETTSLSEVLRYMGEISETQYQDSQSMGNETAAKDK